MPECEYSPNNQDLCGQNLGKSLYDRNSSTCNCEDHSYCGEYKRIHNSNQPGFIAGMVQDVRRFGQELSDLLNRL